MCSAQKHTQTRNEQQISFPKIKIRIQASEE